MGLLLPKYADGGYYLGAFDHERMHGRGLFVWPDGSQVGKGGYARARGRAVARSRAMAWVVVEPGVGRGGVVTAAKERRALGLDR